MATTEPLPDVSLATLRSHHPFTLENQEDWAAAIARRVARRGEFRWQELDDLISVAKTTLSGLYGRSVRGTRVVHRIVDFWLFDEEFSHVEHEYIELGFDIREVPLGGDPEGAFRGWAHDWIKSECVRYAKRLRNAGTYYTTRPENEPAQACQLGESGDGLEDEAETGVEYLDVARVPGVEITDDLTAVPRGRRLACGRRSSG
jgi:hypothetical protein